MWKSLKSVCRLFLQFEEFHLSWPRSHDSQSRDLRVMRSWYHKILLVKWFWTNFNFWINNMKIFSEIFDSVYKIILHFILLLAEQHELMIFKLKLNIIYKTDDDYISMKHCFNVLSSKKMTRSEFKADKFHIMIQLIK